MSKKKICDRNLVFVDCETTGLDNSQHEIIEMAAIVYDPRQDKIIKTWECKAAPRNIETANPIALDINGYNKDPESYKDNIEDIIFEFHKILGDDIIIGQNIQFDIGFIEKYYKEFSIDKGIHRHRKLELSSIVWPIAGYSDIENLSLNTLCTFFGVSNEGAHRALVDCERTLEVYKCLINSLKIMATDR